MDKPPVQDPREAVKQLLAGLADDRDRRKDQRFRTATRQVRDVHAALDRDATEYLHMPWASADALIGGIAPATLIYLLIMSGNGKTMTLSSFTEEMLSLGQKVYVMPLESTPHVFRTHLAARKLGYDPGDLLSGAYLQWPDHKQVRDAVKAETELVARAEGDAWENLQISDQKYFSAKSVWYAAAEAFEAGADWFIPDHTDHLEVAEYAESFAANLALFEAKNRYGFRVFASSQVNHQVTHGNPLAPHVIPSPHWMKFGAHKMEKADIVIGGCRPLKVAGVDEGLLKRYRNRDGSVSMSEVCEPNTTLWALLKHRLYGGRVGQRCYLGVERGRIRDVNQSLYTRVTVDSEGFHHANP